MYDKAATELFRIDLIEDIASYLPDNHNPEEFAATISGRMLEEQVELHLASGGTAASTFSHVADAITNESFKERKRLGSVGGVNQDAYPSKLSPKYDKKEVATELADSFIQWNLNRLNSNISLSDILEEVQIKMAKLDKAKKEGKLILTSKGTYYINKNGDK